MLETKRLLLKKHTLGNALKMNKWENDKVLLYYDDDVPEDEELVPIESTKKYIEKIIKNNDDSILRLGIHKKEQGLLIGFCMIAFIDTYNKSCKLGITIGEKNEWGKGYAKEAVNELIRYCFEELNMNRIGVEIYSFNDRSIKLFEGLGFVREGIIRELVFKKGKFEDEYVYGLLRRDWEKTAGSI